MLPYNQLIEIKYDMRLLITHNGIMKVFPNATCYEELISFIHENFPTLKKNSFVLNYLDSDNDMVSLGSQMDLQTMNQTISSHYVKVFLKEQESDEQIPKQNLKQNSIPSTQYVQQVQQLQSKIQNKNEKIDDTPDELPINKVEEISSQIKQVSNKSQINQERQQNSQGRNIPRCGGFWSKRKWFGQMSEAQCQERKRQWKEKMNEQIAKRVDQRIETLLPLIVKKVQESLKGEKKELISQKIQKSEGKVPVSVHKNVKCNLCWVQPIIGTRYKCLRCPSFNLCSECEPKADHNHNMIKMKYQEDPEVKSYQKPFKLEKMSDCNMRDPKFALTKKCFKLASIYGGQPEQYVQYVNQHLYEPIPALIQKYRHQNKVSFSQRMGAKLQSLAKKLAFYFNKKAEDFLHLVQENPNLHFKGLLRKAQEEQEEAKLIQEISKIEKEKSVIKVQIPILKVQEKIQQVKQLKKEEPKEKQSMFGIFSIKPIKQNIEDPTKRANVILRLKDIFGQQKSYEYLQFYNNNSWEQIDVIVDKYIQTQFQ